MSPYYADDRATQREHQTQKPIEVMRHLVRLVPPGGVVLDPFMGSGTTGVAALADGRRFIGSELTDHYAEVAKHRISTGVSHAAVDVEQAALDFGAAV